MLILLVDTAGSAGSVLLARSESVSPELCETQVLGTGVLEPRQFSIQLISVVTELLQTNHLVLAEVDGFAVISGPGSFTGLRVGLSAVKAMAEVMAKPVIALSRLAVMASTASQSGAQSHAALVHAVIDAGRGEFYHGMYRDAGGTCVAESLQTHSTLTRSFEQLPGLVVAWEQDVLNTLADFAPRQILPPTVSEALPLALAAWGARRFSDAATLDANYLRRLDVENGPKPIRPDPPPPHASGV
ncbi:MAG TPA: tRNA (adenosine(37)-N6)-threonylcarbamoyltransferase complex dimerization subunit type 1 TsaB [Acidobacteriaceae bacterium]